MGGLFSSTKPSNLDIQMKDDTSLATTTDKLYYDIVTQYSIPIRQGKATILGGYFITIINRIFSDLQKEQYSSKINDMMTSWSNGTLPPTKFVDQILALPTSSTREELLQIINDTITDKSSGGKPKRKTKRNLISRKKKSRRIL